ncbi:hypothetical protein ACTHGU_11390 [Chitinophagaceae bacterium MMS25-I14]
MLTRYLALVSESGAIDFSQTARIAAALQKQITRDFRPVWGIDATISAYTRLEDVPSDYWTILIKDNIGYAGAAGIHLDRDGQPYALVESEGNVALTCSHEAIEMLADPFGNRLVASGSIMPGQGRVKYLVEVCDPSEDISCGYTVNGLTVSDFYTPHYFDPVTNVSTKYSFTGVITAPRQVLKNGYLSWMLPETREWWQATFFGESLEFRSLGVLQKDGGRSWREIIDSRTFEARLNIAGVQAAPVTSAVSVQSFAEKAAHGRAFYLREDIDNVLKSARSMR